MNRRAVLYRASDKGRGGFTLLETILVLAIVSGVLAILGAVVRIGLTSWEKGEEKASRMAVKKVFAQKFFEDASSMYPYMTRGDQSTEYRFMGGPRRLMFVTAAHSGGFAIPWGGLTLVDYRAEKEGLAVLEKTLPEADSPGTSERTLEFGKNIKDVAFEYLGGDGWTDGWDAGVQDSLPKAVRASVKLLDGGDFTVTAPVRASKYWAGDNNNAPQAASPAPAPPAAR